jgi:hypothetical protein
MVSAAEVSRMPKVTLYVKDSDAPTWDKARQIAGDSLSSIVARALAAYVEEHEKRVKAQAAIEQQATVVVLDVEPEDAPRRKVKLTAVLAVEGVETLLGWQDAYVTTSGKVVLALNQRTAKGLRVESVEVFEDYDEFVQANPNSELGPAIAETLGRDWIEEID